MPVPSVTRQEGHGRSRAHSSSGFPQNTPPLPPRDPTPQAPGKVPEALEYPPELGMGLDGQARWRETAGQGRRLHPRPHQKPWPPSVLVTGG